MNSDLPTSWMNSVRQAARTLLFVAVAAFVAWQLLRQLLVPLVVIVMLFAIIRVAVGWSRRDGW